ncbi:MAG: regulatory signaling modulator protein AmpE [Pseudomonas sp.]
MSFLVLLLVLWVEKFSSWRARIQQDGAWLRLLARVERQTAFRHNPWLQLAVLVLLPLAALALLLAVISVPLHGWLALPVHLWVLVYSLGRGDPLVALGPFRDAWRREDVEAAYLVAQRDLGVEAGDADSLLQQAQGFLLWQGYQSFFAVIFWYALLGPLAALAYRLLALTAERAEDPALRARAAQWRHAFDWLPVRLLAGSFALVGSFVAVSRALLHELLNWNIPAAQLIANSGRAAEEFGTPALGESGVSSLDGLWQLLVRAGVFWYAGFAVWTLLF